MVSPPLRPRLSREDVIPIFRAADTNGDNRIDESELGAIFRKSTTDPWKEARVARVLQAADKNEDGVVDLDELVEWLLCHGADQNAFLSNVVSAVFSYGTLRGDFNNSGDKYGVIKESEAQWHSGEVVGFQLYQYDGLWYPFAVWTGRAEDKLIGTLLQFPTDEMARCAIQRCDRIEGFDADDFEDGLYQRAVVRAKIRRLNKDDGEELLSTLAFIYYQSFPFYDDGLWLGFRRPACDGEVRCTAFFQQRLGLTFDAMFVKSVEPGSPGAQAGVGIGWEVVSVNMNRVMRCGGHGEAQGTIEAAVAKLPKISESSHITIIHFVSGDWFWKRAAAKANAENRHPVFGFGSNSISQLRGRLADPSLKGYAARVHHHVLAFAGPNSSWAFDDEPVGTATLVPASGKVALGTVAFLTDDQRSILDGFEGVPFVYNRGTLIAEVLRNGEWNEMYVCAYLRQDVNTYMEPSEAYRCAVMRNLRGSFPAFDKLQLHDAEGQQHGEWTHPGYQRLGLAALLFEVGSRKTIPWTLPADIRRILGRLREAGINSGADIVTAVKTNADVMSLDDEERAIVIRLLSSEATALSHDDHYMNQDIAWGMEQPLSVSH